MWDCAHSEPKQAAFCFQRRNQKRKMFKKSDRLKSSAEVEKMFSNSTGVAKKQKKPPTSQLKSRPLYPPPHQKPWAVLEHILPLLTECFLNVSFVQFDCDKSEMVNHRCSWYFPRIVRYMYILNVFVTKVTDRILIYPLKKNDIYIYHC